MSEAIKSGAKQGLKFGVAAGIIFGLMEVIGAAVMGNPPLMPVRMFASVVMGQSALQAASIGLVFIVGVIVHLLLSAAFGAVYGAINGRLGAESRASWGRQAGFGILFGVALWLVNFHALARILYPWFLNTPQFMQMMMHALFFGLPLGLMYAAAQQRRGHRAAGTRRVTV